MKAASLLLGLLIVFDLSAANWPQFRGPQAGGVDTNAVAPTRWDVGKGENVRWQTTIPGLAHSSPIIWGDRVYVTTAVRPGKADLKVGLYGDIESASDQDPHQWRLLALDKASGKIVFDKLGYEAVPRVKRHTKSSHCNSTPATDGKRVVALFGSEGLFCFDLDGQLLWKKDLGPMDSGYYQVPSAQWGFASSPVIHDGKVVVLCDVQTNSFLAAFNLTDGKELWRTPRKDVPTLGHANRGEGPRANTNPRERLASQRRLRFRDRSGSVEAQRRRRHSRAHAGRGWRPGLLHQRARKISSHAGHSTRCQGRDHAIGSRRDERRHRVVARAAGELHADTHRCRRPRLRLP